MLLLALRDLQHRRRQFVVAAIGSALVFAMALVLAGLSGGFRAEVRNTVGAVNADGFVVRAGGGGPFSGYVAMDADRVEAVAALPGVRRAAPLVVSPQPIVPAGGGKKIDAHLIGYAVADLGGPRVSDGRLPARPGEAAVDSRSGLDVGSRFTMSGQALTVVGLTKGLTYGAGVPNVYVGLADAQAAAYGGVPSISAIAVQGTPTDLPADLGFMTSAQAQRDALRFLDNALVAVDNCQAFLWVVAAVIIGTVAYLSVLEKLADFAVLKAVGARSRQLYLSLAVQSVLVAVVAAVVAMCTARLLSPVIPMPTEIGALSMAALPVVALLVGLAASLAGLRQAIRVDPARAFA